jgi:tetratricopeptide (TPR) repeat protein
MARSALTLPGRGASPWLYGPATDLLIGCGGAYLLSIPVLLGLAYATGTFGWSTTVATLLALLVSGPHYGATLLRVYRESADRRKYRLFAVHATIALAIVYPLALRSIWLGSWLLTLYVSLAVWHFASQNYGVALMLLRRRGVAISDDTKRWFHLVFTSSFALSLLLIHVQGSSYVLAIGADDAEGYGILRMGIPFAAAAPLAAAIGALHVLSLVAAARGFLRVARPRDLTPALVIVSTQSVWYTVPGLLLATGGLLLNALPFTAVWISVAHAAQYLWVTSYYAKRAEHGEEPARHVAHALLAGVLIMTVPALVCAPSLLGRVPWDAGLAVITFSVLNLHHFLLDGAVWKLRDGRVARALLHAGEPRRASRAAARAAPRAHAGALLWAIGTPCLALALFAVWQADVASSGDPDRARGALERLRWLGRDSASLRVVLGSHYAEHGDVDAAIAEYRRSLSLMPTADAWAALSVAYDRRRDWDAAREADDRALELDPTHTVGLIHAADLALRRAAELGPADAARERERASALILRALASRDPTLDPVTRLLGLTTGLESAGRSDDARLIREVMAIPSALTASPTSQRPRGSGIRRRMAGRPRSASRMIGPWRSSRRRGGGY